MGAYLPGFGEISKAMLGVCGGLGEREAQVRLNKNVSASAVDFFKSGLSILPAMP